MAVTPKLFYSYNFIKSGADGASVDDLPSTGGTAVTVATDVNDTNGILYGLAIDPAAGVYFVTDIQGSNSYIYEEHFGQTALSKTPLSGGPLETSLDDQISSLALNAGDDILYFTAGTGFYEEKFTGANFSGTPSEIQLAILPNTTSETDDQLVFDQADHSAYFAAPAGHRTFTTNTAGTKEITISNVTKNYIYKVSNVTAGAAAGSLSSQVAPLNLGPGNQLPKTDGEISGVALDSATDTLYIISKPVIGSTTSDVEGLYAYKISTGAVSTIWSQTDPSGNKPLNNMTYITVDPTTGDYYISDGDESSAPGIYEGSTTSSALPTLLLTLPPPVNNEASGDVAEALAIDLAPNVASDKVTAISGAGAGVTTGTVTTANTVTISVTFSESVNVTGAPTLTLNDGGSATYVSGSGTSAIVFSYTPSNGQNIATLATTGAVSGGSFADVAGTPADLTNLAQSFTGLRVQTTPPALAVTGQIADVVQGGAAVTLLQSASITEPVGAVTVAKATITITNAKTGDELSISGLSNGTVDGGAITVSGNDTSTLTLTGGASSTEYQTLLDSVTYEDTGSDTTTSGHPVRTIDWSVNDGTFTSNVAATTVTIDRAPTVTAGGSATFDGGQSTPATLDPGLKVADLDGGALAGATVTISSGFIFGDTLTFTNQNGITGSFSNSKLSLSGAASIANYQTALDSLAYSFSPTNGDPTGGGLDTSRTISWTVNDGVTSSAAANSTLSLVHEPPVLTVGGTVDYSEIGSPVALDPTLSVSDPDSAGQLVSALVTISSGFEAGDTLTASLAGTNGITPTYNPNTGSFFFSGEDTLSDYQAVLSSIAFSTTAGDTSPTSRTITWTINDGVASNATSQTSMVDVAPCYVRGTRILTERGEVAVEHLHVGDIAITASRQRRPIVWIGRRALDLARHPDPAAVRPVRVRADAFGVGLPRRDLWLSPGHNLAFGGVLIAARLLINDRSVAQIALPRVEYWHVELDAHDILLAEGQPAESYLDTGNRTAFSNSGGFVEAHPDFQPRHWAQTCLPLALDGPAVSSAKARLLARLAEQGCAASPEADPHVWIDGLRVEPFWLSQTRLAFVLPSRGCDIVLRSRDFIPAHTLADGDDPRSLGLCVGGLQIDGAAFDLTREGACESGWHRAEFEGELFSHRWTTGSTRLPPGAQIVIVDLAGLGSYWSSVEDRSGDVQPPGELRRNPGGTGRRLPLDQVVAATQKSA